MKATEKDLMQYGAVLVLVLCLGLMVTPVPALKDPSAVYCIEMGYNFTTENLPAGETGYCILNDGKKVDAWRFLQGKNGTESGYCAKKGYPQKIVYDPGICIQFLTDSCAVCVLPDGSEVEVTRLMNLSFTESRCGDHVCGYPENNLTCPADCPTGASDEYCDGIFDGRCDRDCRTKLGGDPDCPVAGIPVIYFVGIALVVAAGAGYLVLKKSWKK